jgi:PAS domain S-box-containing protein
VTKVRVLIVEDEVVVAVNLRDRLQQLDYEIPAIVFSGEEALQHVAETRPDLVLMDIRLQGEMDGVETAREIYLRFNVPVIYLTGHADDVTLQRAKITEPFGYVLKPFTIKELHSTIEMALYKHKMERKLKESEVRYRTISEVTSDFAYAVRVEADNTLMLEWLTQAFERITGFSVDNARGDDIWKDLVHPDDISLAGQHLRTMLSGYSDVSEYRIITKKGAVRWLRDYGHPVWDEAEGRIVRVYGAAQDITERRQNDEERERLILELQNALAKVKALRGLLPICASCKKIRDDKGYWTQVEVYILEHSDAEFTHGICPECAKKLYPDFAKAINGKE